MNDKQIIEELYIKLCNASINKDFNTLNEILAEDYILVHMTGRIQTKQEYINSVKNGELKYYDSINESIDITINGDEAFLVGRTKTLASPFGFGKSWWNLKQDIKLKKLNNKWMITKSVASSY